MNIKIKITRDINASLLGCRTNEVIEIPLQDYLFAVVASEIGNAHIEACKAQAIAARTNVIKYVLSSKPVLDTSSSLQAFRADKMDERIYPNAKAAVDLTDGLVLYYNGKIADPCSFSSSNGGRTTSSQTRWGGHRAWLIEQDDPWDKTKKIGHGVGMSQNGAKYAASIGKTCEDILDFYFPGTIIHTVEEGDNMAYATVKASYLILKFQYMVDNRWGYIANATGIKWTRERQNAATDSMTKQYGAQWIDHMVADCSGAFYYWYKQVGSYMYHGSNTMWRQYATVKGRIGEIELVPGMAVYKMKRDGNEPSKYADDGLGNFYHVGQYIGNGKVIEAKGTKAGVVISCVSDGWTHTSRLKYTEYDVTDDSTELPSENGATGVVTLTSGTLNLRKSPSASSTILQRIPNHEQVFILEEEDGWYKIKYNGTVGFVSSNYITVTKPTGAVGDDKDTYRITLSGLSLSASESIRNLLIDKGHSCTVEKEVD